MTNVKTTVMTNEILLLTLISLAMVFLIIECATEVADAIRFFLYKGSSIASVVEKEPFAVSRSKRLVEQNEDHKGYLPVRETQDKNSNYPYIFSPGYWMYREKAVCPTLEWGTEEIPGERITLMPENGLPARRLLCVIMTRVPGSTPSGIELLVLVSC